MGSGGPGQSWYDRMAAKPENWTTGEVKRALESGDHRPEVLQAAVRYQPLAGLVRDTVSPEALQAALNYRDDRTPDEILSALGFWDAS